MTVPLTSARPAVRRRIPAPAGELRHRRLRPAVDVLAAVVGLSGAVLARFGGPAALAGVDYRLLALLAAPAWPVAVAASGGYDRRTVGLGSEEARRLADASVRLLAVVVVLGFVLHVDLARSVVAAGVGATLVLSLLGRWVARSLLRRSRRHGLAARNVLVVGAGAEVARAVEALRRAPDRGLAVTGVCVPAADVAGFADTGLAVADLSLGPGETALRFGCDAVAVAGAGPLGENGLRELAWSLEGTGVELFVAPALLDVTRPRLTVVPVGGLPLLHLDPPRLSGRARVVKGALDRVVAALGLLLLAPVLLVLMAAVRLTSPGPALYRQVRVGRDGRTFVLLKLRTMRAGAPAPAGNDADGPLFKLRDDPRLAPLGRTLRRWSLDELPQLLNVLRGDMSLVGPRPPLPGEVECYEPRVQRRLLVTPGLTGLWQVNGRSDLPWREAVRLDLAYVENWSLSLDLAILARTVGAVLRGRGAY